VPPPRERLVGHPDVPVGGPAREEGELFGGELVVVDRRVGDRRAHEDRVDAELGHQVELAFRPGEVGDQPVGRHRFEVPERLVEVDAEAEVGTAPPDVPGRPRRDDQVVLEQLDAVEARGRCGGELVVEGAGQTDGRDGAAESHRAAPTSSA